MGAVRVAQEVRRDRDLGDASEPGARLTRFHALTALIGTTRSSPKVSSVRSARSSSQVPRESRTTRVLPPLPVTLATPSRRLRQRSVTNSETRRPPL
jgi:hypothetical protein